MRQELLPRVRVPPNGGGNGAAHPFEGDAQAPPRILIVDDDEALCEVLRLVLIGEGYDVQTASQGKRALELLHAHAAPDLVVLDLMMPLVSGWAVWDALQAKPSLRDIPVIVFTATGSSTGALGGATVVAKTDETDVLLGHIQRLLRRR